MDMDMALKDLTREMNALEMEIRMRGFVLATSAAEGQREREQLEPRFADTHVGYFGIWE